MSRRFGPFRRIGFVASDTAEAEAAHARLAKRYGDAPPKEADLIVALGGDGLMLQTLHRFIRDEIPIFGMNRGSVGFLMNEYHEADLLTRLDKAKITNVHPLAMRAETTAGKVEEALAINEVSLFRQRHQAAKLRISVDAKVRLEELICDGVLVSTPAGSTAYNLSAYGPILPVGTHLLALTPLSPFRPRRWRGALIPSAGKIDIEVLEPDKRPVNAVADNAETVSVSSVHVEEARSVNLYMMFDPGHSLDERILAEQFRY